MTFTESYLIYIYMEATRIQITPITQQKLDKPLSMNERMALRRQKMIDYIKSKPLGTPIRIEEFGEASKTTKANAQLYIKKMLDDGTILREALSPKKFCYSVQDSQVKVIRAATMRWTAPELEDIAMRFAWNHPEHHNDLHSFIIWLKDGKIQRTVKYNEGAL